jgi:hypothetical protein
VSQWWRHFVCVSAGHTTSTASRSKISIIDCKTGVYSIHNAVAAYLNCLPVCPRASDTRKAREILPVKCPQLWTLGWAVILAKKSLSSIQRGEALFRIFWCLLFCSIFLNEFRIMLFYSRIWTIFCMRTLSLHARQMSRSPYYSSFWSPN